MRAGSPTISAFPITCSITSSASVEAVIEDFADSYVRGETPIPCVRCNQKVKFRDLLETARDLGADAMATGHYVRREDGPDGPELHRACDLSRDQSYFLFATTRDQLSFLRFPLGALTKTETRAHAARFGLTVAGKPDSQDICFVPQGDYARVVEKLRPDAAADGDIVHIDGRVLGRHNGVTNYTIGQRRGLHVGGESAPLYVVRLEPKARRVVVGPAEALGSAHVFVTDVNWLGGEGDHADLSVKLRSTQPLVPATLRRHTDGSVEVELAEPQTIAPGQACVFYRDERVLGGGFIQRDRTRNAA